MALVDVLGWSELMRRSVTEPPVLSAVSEAAVLMSMAPDYVQEVNQFQKTISDGHTRDMLGTNFSDTFVLSHPADRFAEENVLRMVGQLCIGLLDRGHYTRGAIVRGLVHHTTNVIFGPAVVEAHKLESVVAKYPRVIVSPSAAELFDRKVGLRTDFDGLLYLDLLGPYKGQDIALLRNIRAQILAKMEADKNDLGRMAKHQWLLNRADESLRRVGAG
ncbi:MAG TPA: hypothetical protein VF550_16790 [Polyangia bacterium]